MGKKKGARKILLYPGWTNGIDVHEEIYAYPNWEGLFYATLYRENPAREKKCLGCKNRFPDDELYRARQYGEADNWGYFICVECVKKRTRPEFVRSENGYHVHLNGEKIGHINIEPQGEGVVAHDLWIHPIQRGRGFAKELIAYVVRKHGDGIIRLNPGPYEEATTNPDSLKRFYEDMGFNKSEEGLKFEPSDEGWPQLSDEVLDSIR